MLVKVGAEDVVRLFEVCVASLVALTAFIFTVTVM